MFDQLLAPLAWPREAVSNLGMAGSKLLQGNATNEDLLAAAPGAAGALAAALAGVPAGLLTGGLLQGGAKMVAPEMYGDKSSALLQALGGDPESGMQHAAGMMAIDPLMWSAFGQAGKAAKLRNAFNERLGLGGPSINAAAALPQSEAEIRAMIEADAAMQAAREGSVAKPFAGSHGFPQFDSMHNQAIDMMQDLQAGDPHMRSLPGLRERIGLGKEASSVYGAAPPQPGQFPQEIYQSLSPILDETEAARLLDRHQNYLQRGSDPMASFYMERDGPLLRELIDPSSINPAESYAVAGVGREKPATLLTGHAFQNVQGSGGMTSFAKQAIGHEPLMPVEEYIGGAKNMINRGFPVIPEHLASGYRSAFPDRVATLADGIAMNRLEGEAADLYAEELVRLQSLLGQGLSEDVIAAVMRMQQSGMPYNKVLERISRMVAKPQAGGYERIMDSL